VSPPWCGKHACADTSAIVRRTADGVCAGRRCIRGNSYHGGLTPPALVFAVRTSADEKRFLRCTYAHPIRSGGREPAVVRDTDAALQNRARAHAGAPFVSPPWVSKPRLQLQCNEFPYFAFASNAPPRGAYAPRSCVAVRTPAGEKAIFAMHKRASDQERRASARRGLVNRVCNCNATNFRISRSHRMHPTGG
jgi:hypothetical protein